MSMGKKKQIKIKRRSIVALASFGVIVVAAVLTFYPPPSSSAAIARATTYQVKTITNVAYGSDPLQKLDICMPIGASSPRPAWIIIHGGGWDSGDKATDSFAPTECTKLAQAGYVAFNINYRLVQNSGAPYPNPSAVDTFPTGFADAQLAVRWVRSRESIYGVDDSKIFAMGFSSGAHYAALLATIRTIYPSDVASVLPRYSPAVAGASAHSTPTDLTFAITGPMNGFGYTDVMNLVNEPATSAYMAQYEAASPLYAVSSKTAPISMTQGTQDTRVLPQQATEMQTALQAAGVPVQLISYNGGHLFGGLSSQSAYQLINKSAAWVVANSRWP